MRVDPATNDPNRRKDLFRRHRDAEQSLIGEISIAARRIDEARDWSGELVYRTDGVWRVLATVATSPYCLAVTDIGRALGVRKQVAHELTHAAARAGVIELATNPDDKRILQALLTPHGRAQLKAAETAKSVWLAVLLNGLDRHEMATTTRVVRVIRQRLERDAREWKRRKAAGSRS